MHEGGVGAHRMKRDLPPPRFAVDPSPIYGPPLRSELQIFAAENGSPIVPKVILWAFRLNEGDLLAVSREEAETFRCRFRSYSRAIWTIATSIRHPWPFIEPLLRLPMAALGSHGKLFLPDEAAALALPAGESLLLVIEPVPGEGFTLEPAAGRRPSFKLFLEAKYALPVESGSRVSLPEDVLWVLGLEEGDLLACKTSLATVDLEPYTQLEPLAGRSLAALGPGGTLSLPEPFLRDLRREQRILLTVTFSPEPALRLTYWIDSA